MKRRTYLKIGAATGATMGIAGCLGGDDDNGDDVGDDDDNGAADPDFPTDNLTWMIPWGEGGGTDQYARQIAPQMEDPLGVSIEIDNREGAGSLVGTEWLANQDPDGYTFGTANSPGWEFTWRANQDAVGDWHPEDLEPISYAGFFGYTLIVNDAYGIEDYGELRDAYQDGDISGFGYQGAGSDSHLTTLILREDYGLEYDTAVPYDGGGPTMEAVISDEVAAGFATNTSAVAAEESGEATAIVNLMDVDISDAFPGIDSISNYGDSLAWITEFGQYQFAPPGTDRELRETISAAVGEGVNSDDVQGWAEETGNIVEYGDVDEAEDRLTGVVDEIESQVDDAVGGFDEFLALAEED